MEITAWLRTFQRFCHRVLFINRYDCSSWRSHHDTARERRRRGGRAAAGRAAFTRQNIRPRSGIVCASSGIFAPVRCAHRATHASYAGHGSLQICRWSRTAGCARFGALTLCAHHRKLCRPAAAVRPPP